MLARLLEDLGFNLLGIQRRETFSSTVGREDRQSFGRLAGEDQQSRISKLVISAGRPHLIKAFGVDGCLGILAPKLKHLREGLKRAIGAWEILDDFLSQFGRFVVPLDADQANQDVGPGGLIVGPQVDRLPGIGPNQLRPLLGAFDRRRGC